MDRELIKKLYQASYKEVINTCDYNGIYYVAEKFAESIIKECAGIYESVDNGNSHCGTEDYLEALQRHFGVK